MPAEEELSRHELMGLFAQGSVADDSGDLQLTGKGRSLLVRGSPALWDTAA